MVLNENGIIAQTEWDKLQNRFPPIELDAFQIMPNHIHGIIVLVVAPNVPHDISVPNTTNNAVIKRAGTSPAPTKKNNTIGDIVGAYKSLVSNEYIKLCKSKNKFVQKLWQRNYYEHIRDNDDLNRIRKYIRDNPKNWEKGFNID